MSAVTSGLTLDEIRRWGGEEVFNQALALANSGAVENVVYDDERVMLSGSIVQNTGWDLKTSVKLEPGGRIRSLCPCVKNQRYGLVCEHVVALGIVQTVREMPDPEEEKRRDGEAAPAAAPEPDWIEVPAKPRFAAYVQGSRASLSVEVDAWYGEHGEIDFPACSAQGDRVVWLEDPDDSLVRRVRSLPSERAAMAELEKFGFNPGYRTGDLKYYLVDSMKVLNFLGTGLPHLRRLGWRVELADKLGAIVDSFTTVAPLVTIRDAGGGAFDVGYSFTAYSENGKEEIPAIEIQAALNRGDGCLLRDGAVTLLDNRAIALMHDVFRDVAAAGSGTPDGGFRVKGVHAAFVKSSLEHLDVTYDDSGAPVWRESADRGNRAHGEAKFEPVPLGALEKVLRPYQKQGVYWMSFLDRAGFSGLLADEMGLGKTLQTLTWLNLLKGEASVGPRPSLIVCPTSLVRNWEAEARKFTPGLRVLVVSGPDRARVFSAIARADLVITSYALLQRDFETAYAKHTFAALVLDEAQHIKNRRTRNAQTAKMVSAERRLVLTGTPIENSVADVWSIFDFLMPGYLGDYESFKLAYELPIAEGGALAEMTQWKLNRKLHPFILRRLKRTVAKDLPDKLVKVSYCPLPDDVQGEYQSVLRKERRGAKTKFEMLALLMKLRQIASRGKVEAFLELLDEAIDGGHRVLVFSQFVKQLTVLRKALAEAGIPHCYLDGSTKDRLGACERFNRDRTIPVFLISLMAGGTGLNLTGADMVVHYDPWWNPAVENQATDRAHRIGQTKKVYVVKLIAADTVEEKVLDLQRRKEAVIAATISDSDEAIVSKLTTEDLAGLLG